MNCLRLASAEKKEVKENKKKRVNFLMRMLHVLEIVSAFLTLSNFICNFINFLFIFAF